MCCSSLSWPHSALAAFRTDPRSLLLAWITLGSAQGGSKSPFWVTSSSFSLFTLIRFSNKTRVQLACPCWLGINCFGYDALTGPGLVFVQNISTSFFSQKMANKASVRELRVVTLVARSYNLVAATREWRRNGDGERKESPGERKRRERWERERERERLVGERESLLFRKPLWMISFFPRQFCVECRRFRIFTAHKNRNGGKKQYYSR